jgi:hypothetical protein
LLEHLHIIGLLPLQRSPLDNALHGLSEVSPGTRMRRREEKNAMRSRTTAPCCGFYALRDCPRLRAF